MVLVRCEEQERLQSKKQCVRVDGEKLSLIQSEVEVAFWTFLKSVDFREVHTPMLLAGFSGGAPHLQEAILVGRRRVYEIGPVFTADDSSSNGKFVRLDLQMQIRRHYAEVMDVVDQLFVATFDHLNENCKETLEAICKEHPFEPLKYLRKTVRLRFEDAIQMLKEAGVEVDPYGDLNTKAKRKLGQLVLERNGTEFYILHRNPLASRPFYTMPSHDDANYSNSFDVFIRGERILSGGQHIHAVEMLEDRARKCKIDLDTIKSYVDNFRYGAPLHGGFGVMVLEHVVKLFCGLNI